MEWILLGVSYSAGIASGLGLKIIYDRSNRSRNEHAATGDNANQTTIKNVSAGGSVAGRDILSN